MYFLRIADTKTVSESGLRNGGKIFLVVKKDECHIQQLSLWGELYRVLKKHFKEPDCTMVLEQMKKVCGQFKLQSFVKHVKYFQA